MYNDILIPRGYLVICLVFLGKIIQRHDQSMPNFTINTEMCFTGNLKDTHTGSIITSSQPAIYHSMIQHDTQFKVCYLRETV